MTVCTIDFETYYDQDYSLSKMTTQEYIEDPRFQIMGFSVMQDDSAPKWIVGGDMDRMGQVLRWLNARHKGWTAQNSLFDFSILAHHFDVHPEIMLDTRSMGNALLKPFTKGASLAVMAEYFRLPPKGDALASFKGRRLETLDEHDLFRMQEYCCHDTWLCRQIYKRLRPDIPNHEIMAIHRVLEMFTKPGLILNPAPLEEALEEERQRQADVLDAIGGFTKADLNSNDRFAAALTIMGVDPPRKISPRTKKPAYAFARKDLEFLALLDHEDPCVVALVEARLAVKSNLIETRAKRLQALAALPSGKLRVPTVYYAAHTGRLGGTDGLNLQNLTRGSKLRQALCAPEGYKIVAADLSQIEARMTAAFVGEQHILQQYRNKEDIYSHLATMIFGRDVNKEEHPAERFVGKVAELSLQYGAAEKAFELMLRTSGQALPRDLPINQLAYRTVGIYRKGHPATVTAWALMDRILKTVLFQGASGSSVVSDPRVQYTDGLLCMGPVKFYRGRIYLPNGMGLVYNQLGYRPTQRVIDNALVDHNMFSYVYNGGVSSIYGAKVLQNIIQALAAIALREYWLHLSKAYRIVLQVHDELVAVVRDDSVERAVQDIRHCMSTPPAWMPDLPVACEIKVGQNYLEAKVV